MSRERAPGDSGGGGRGEWQERGHEKGYERGHAPPSWEGGAGPMMDARGRDGGLGARGEGGATGGWAMGGRGGGQGGQVGRDVEWRGGSRMAPDGGGRPCEVAQLPPWKIRDVALQRGEFASATREMVELQALT